MSQNVKPFISSFCMYELYTKFHFCYSINFCLQKQKIFFVLLLICGIDAVGIRILDCIDTTCIRMPDQSSNPEVMTNSELKQYFSGDLNSKPVEYSDYGDLLGCQMLCYSEHHLVNQPVFRPHNRSGLLFRCMVPCI